MLVPTDFAVFYLANKLSSICLPHNVSYRNGRIGLYLSPRSYDHCTVQWYLHFPNCIWNENKFSLGPPESSTQTASWSVQPFLHGSLRWQADRQTDRPLYSVSSNRPHLRNLLRCGRIRVIIILANLLFLTSIFDRKKRVQPLAPNWPQTWNTQPMGIW